MKRDRNILLHYSVTLEGKLFKVIILVKFFYYRAVLEYDIERYMHISFLFDFKGFSVIILCKCVVQCVCGYFVGVQWIFRSHFHRNSQS